MIGKVDCGVKKKKKKSEKVFASKKMCFELSPVNKQVFLRR